MPKRSLPPLPEWYPRGTALLRDPTLNKGTAFSEQERDVLGLRGLLPPHVATQDEQLARVLENFHRLQTPLSKYIMLSSLLDRNEALFFRVVMDHADTMMPIIYTPTVGLACQQFGHIYRRPRGLLRHGRRSRAHLAGHAQLAAPRGGDDRRHRRRAHPRARRPRRERHGHSHRQALAVHRAARACIRGSACP